MLYRFHIYLPCLASEGSTCGFEAEEARPASNLLLISCCSTRGYSGKEWLELKGVSSWNIPNKYHRKKHRKGFPKLKSQHWSAPKILQASSECSLFTIQGKAGPHQVIHWTGHDFQSLSQSRGTRQEALLFHAAF